MQQGGFKQNTQRRQIVDTTEFGYESYEASSQKRIEGIESGEVNPEIHPEAYPEKKIPVFSEGQRFTFKPTHLMKN